MTARLELKGGTALIVGAGAGLSASVARALKAEGMSIALAARSTDKLAGLAEEVGAKTYACDAGDAAAVATLFEAVEADLGSPKVVLYNPSARSRASIVDLVPDEVDSALRISAFGGFLVGQQAAKRMVETGEGAIFFTGASASVKGYPLSAPFAMGKFALRGLAQSMARELAPKNIHVAHFVIDGAIRSDARPEDPAHPDKWLDPDAIAETYLSVLKQHRSAWSWEVEVRPWVETF